MKLKTKYIDILGTNHPALRMMTSYKTVAHCQNQKLIGTIQLSRLQILIKYHPLLNSLNFV